MGQSSGNKVFEELNPFPEKVADSLSIDGGESITLDDPEITGSHEEILLSGEVASRPSKMIEDEHIPLGFKNRSNAPASDIFDIESLSLEIDSMGAFSEKVEKSIAKNDFWDVLDDEEIKMIDDVSMSSGDSFLDTLEPVHDLGTFDTGDDKALLIQERDESETSPLWLENNDFVVTEIEGFGDIKPSVFISALQSGSLKSKKVESPVTEIPTVLIDGSPVGTSESSASAPKPQTSHRKRKYDDIDIPFIIVDTFSSIPEYEESVNDRGIVELESEDTAPVLPPAAAKKEVKVPDTIRFTPIDLNEAEKVAREEMVLLNEDDLIEELETYDLTPAKDEQKTVTSITRNFDYLTPRDSAITDAHRSSIEEDVQSENAVIIEENVDDIYAKLGNMTKVIIDNRKDEIIDITDKIVILDDESAMQTFLETMPEEKRTDMKKLLEYLDGLFDKLPEDVVKRFAESEYFDLYVNVMNELEGTLMGLLERAKNIKSSPGEDSSVKDDDYAVIENITPVQDLSVFENFNAENFDSAEMIRLDSDDSIFNDKSNSAPVKSDDIIIDDITSEDADDSSDNDYSAEDSAEKEEVVSFDGELEDFLSIDAEPSIDEPTIYIPETVDESVKSFNEEPLSEDVLSESNIENMQSFDEQNKFDSADPFSDPEAALDEKDLLADIDSVEKNNPRPEPIIFPSAPHVSDDFFGVLNEASRELLRSNSSEDFFNVLLLLVMGQFTASSAAILVPVDIEEPQGKWTLRDVRGIRLKNRSVTFRGIDPLMGQILESRNILDIEEFAGLEGFREECSIFYSIGGRYILPIRAKGVTRVILALGNKISGNYEPAEIENMRVYASTVSPVFERLMDIEKITEENRQYIERNTEYSDIDKIERDLRRSSGGADVESIIEEKMNHYGAESFCFFVRNERGDALVPRFCEKADLMGLKASGFSIPADSELCSYFIQKDEWEDFENPASFSPLRSAFTDTHIIKMNLCAAYPFLMRGYIAGLLIVMRGKRERIADTKMHIMRLSRHVFSFLQGNAAISVYESPFSDIIGKPMLRMEKTLSMADDLGITVSCILFHLKNLKRYRSVYGTADSETLMLKIREILESRISHSDYGIRIESGKVIVVLPGKTKKYAVPFATAVRNEMNAAFRERESQIMLTYLIAEYPADGKTLYDILDYLS